MNDFELGWVVAFLEGEGSFLFNSGYTVTATQKDPWPLEKIQALLGGTIRPFIGGIRRVTYLQWRLYGEPAKILMESVYAHMSPRRQDQILAALSHPAPGPHNSQKTVCPRGHMYSGENLYIRKNGHRLCRECWRIRQRRAS